MSAGRPFSSDREVASLIQLVTDSMRTNLQMQTQLLDVGFRAVRTLLLDQARVFAFSISRIMHHWWFS